MIELVEALERRKAPNGRGDILHDKKTGEPVFNVSKNSSYGGRDVRVSWHPHMHALYPHLKHSLEFGNAPGHAKDYTDAISKGENHYNNALEGGMRDAVDHEIEETPEKKIHHYYDPETREHIGSKDAQEYSSGFKYNPEYIKKHNIDMDKVKSKIKNAKESDYTNRYQTAKIIHSMKGSSLSKSLTGDKTIGESKSKMETFHIKNMNDEEGSKAHENILRNEHDIFNVTRHSPTRFEWKGSKFRTPYHGHSVAEDGKLTHHVSQVPKENDYESRQNMTIHNIEEKIKLAIRKVIFG